MAETRDLVQELFDAERYLRSCIGGQTPQLLCVLGSGLGHVADQVDEPTIVPFADVPHLKEATLSEQSGRFVIGTLGNKCVLIMQGRLHGYEGYSAQDVAFPVWLAHRLGIRTLIATNAAGSIDKDLAPGDFCVISDHINFTGRNPIAGETMPELGPRFFSMEDAYDAKLRELALNVASDLGIHAKEGVYLALLGPSFETPAEIRMFATMGASTVAMSLCEEVIAARQVGMRVLGINLISNYAAGLSPQVLDETNFKQELLRVFATARENATRLIEGIVASMDL